MAKLETTYAGIRLRNPVIVSSSGLTDSVDKIIKLEEYGAGAVILKSLFEEQINYESGRLMESSDYPEAGDYIRYYTRNNNVENYLRLIEEARKKTGIPVMASINCVSTGEWVNFAKQIEEAGAHGLELNVYFLPVKKHFTAADYEKIYLELATKITELISIPVIMKLGFHFTNLVRLVDELYYRNIKAAVLFNRFYAPDINIKDLKMSAAEVFSTPSDNRNTLRWVGIVSAEVEKMDLAASTGIHTGEGIIKQLLAGAKAVQVCSVLYKKGPEYLTGMIKEVNDWMDKRGFERVDDFLGSMNYKKLDDPAIYERSQFMRYFSSHH